MSETVTDPNTTNNNGGGDQLPGWARAQISSANDEAASNRIAARDAKAERDNLSTQLTTANTEKAEATTRADKAEASLLRIEIALAAGVPGDRVKNVAERLKGSTEAELKADADLLVKDFGINASLPSQRPTDHSQGHGSETPATPNTPEAAFSQMWSEYFKN